DGRIDLVSASEDDRNVSILLNPAATFNGFFTGNGTSLTNLNASSLNSGIVADSRLSANVGLLNGNQTFTGTNTMTGVAVLTNTNNVLAGNGFALTGINASNITSGTLADARLSTKVPLTGNNNNFIGTNSLGSQELRLRDGADANHALGWFGSSKP